jgi:aryl-alcohol dehydrogenase-like predicted oxidoreductase
MKFCLGTVQFGMNYGIHQNKKLAKSEIFKLLRHAYSSGIDMFDTASAYGDAEEILGEFIEANIQDRSKVRVISKGKFEDGDLIDGVKQSLFNIKIDCLYGYMLHDAEIVFDKLAMNRLNELKDRGLTQKVGVSIYTPLQALKCLECSFIDMIQVPYNVFDNRLDKVNFFEIAKNKGVEIFARSVLLQGLLTMDVDRLPLNMKFVEPYLKKYNLLSKKYAISTFEIAVKYVMSHKFINYMVFGVDNIVQLDDYLNIYDVMDENLKNELDKIFLYVDERVLMPNMWKLL